MTEKITVYSKANCPQCEVAKGKLKVAGVAYKEIRVDTDPAARTLLLQAGHRAVPVIYRGDLPVKLETLLG